MQYGKTLLLVTVYCQLHYWSPDRISSFDFNLTSIFLLPPSQLLGYFFDPKYPFLPEKNIIITIRTIDCMPTGCMSLYLGFYQVSLAFFPGAAEWHSNNNKIQNQKQTQIPQINLLYVIPSVWKK